ncbi:MAG: autotransporter outer membrane beta-barrel domain-containing protein, partial [Brevundimonas sp.]|nr:autotransporter outer membrane beta-barrel domain-containing protein [Brevundimonas sp.]
MRYLYATAAAIAPLLFACGANAQVTISSSRTTPITTANPAGSGPADIIIASGGTITLTSGTAVTVNSDNDFSISAGGNITMSNAASDSIAVLIQGGNTADITIAGSITITDSLGQSTDSDGDGDLDGPFATGSNRFGIRLDAGGPMTGNVRMQSSSIIQVEGNESFGVSLESDLIGNLTNQGTIQVVGNNSMGVRALGDIDGTVYLGGTVATLGGGSTAIGLFGDITGGLNIQGSVSSTGYRYISRPSAEAIARLDADDLLQGGPAVVIAGNVAGGVTFGSRPTDEDEDEADEDGDGIPDADETTAQIDVYGEAPAILVGSDTQAITLGLVGTGDLAYGFINQGGVSAQGVYDGVEANGIRFGLEGGQAVTIEGGILNSGRVSALAYAANAVGVRLSSGVSTPQFINDGDMTAASASEVSSTVTTLLIEAGANLPTFTNNGQFLASSGGGTADLTALLDLSGTLTSITNTGSMQSNIFANTAGDPITGTATLINVE